MDEAAPPERPRMALRPTAERFALFYGVWLLLSEMRVEFLLPGLLAAALAAGISGRIWRTGGKRLRVTALPLYLPGFLWRSLKGGVDVAWRVLHPRLPIAPAFMRHHCRETDETARVLFCDAMTLMPGSLGIRLEGYDLDLHLLSDEAHLRRGIEAEEQRMLDLFRSPAVRRNPPTRGGTRA